jgi:two-component system NarL family sensor kinase
VALSRVPGAEPPVFAGYIRDVTGQKRTEERALKQSRAIADLAQARGELVSQLMLAEERTRQRIAQVLHDDALQRLLAARQDVLEASGPAGVKRVQRALEGTIERIREAVAALHPVTHQQGDLQTALSAVVRQHATRGGFRYTVRVEAGASGVEDELVLSAAQELVANVAKHAQASRCSLSVERRGDRIDLEVADDGVGIPAGRQERALREGHIGLASTVQRMKAIGGDGKVSSEVGKGTVVRASIPIGQPDATGDARHVSRSSDRL